MGSEPTIPSPWNGSAKISVSSGSGRVVTAVHHQAGNFGTLWYLGILAGARNLGMPYIAKGIDGWEASLTLQNLETTGTYVYLYFYDSNGSQIASPLPYYLAGGASRELYSELPSGYSSVRIYSNSANVSAVIHESHTSGRNYGYIAVP